MICIHILFERFIFKWHCCILADYNADALVRELGHLVKRLAYRCKFFLGSPRCCRLHFLSAIAPWLIEMNRYKKLILSCIRRHYKSVITSLGYICIVSGNKEESVLIISAGSSYGVNECLVNLVGDFIHLIIRKCSCVFANSCLVKA